MSNVQIPQELWTDLARYHLLEDPDPALPARIRATMMHKVDAMARRQAFTAYRTAQTPEAREQALDKYLRQITDYCTDND